MPPGSSMHSRESSLARSSSRSPAGSRSPAFRNCAPSPPADCHNSAGGLHPAARARGFEDPAALQRWSRTSSADKSPPTLTAQQEIELPVEHQFSVRYLERESEIRVRKPKNKNWLSANKTGEYLSAKQWVSQPMKAIFGIDRKPKIGRGSRLVHPDSFFHLACTLISCGLLLYVVVFVQIEVAFYWRTGLCDTQGSEFTENFDIFVDCWFLLEMALGFVTGKYVEGRYVDDFKIVAAKYLTGAFWFDFCTCVPESIIEAVIKNSACRPQAVVIDSHLDAESIVHSQTRLLSILQLLRPLRVFRLFRMARLGKKFEQLRHMLPVSGVGVRVVHGISKWAPSCAWAMSKIGFIIVCIVHTCSCLFWLVKEVSSKEEDIADFLEDHLLPRDASVTDRYTLSFYFINTIFTTVGFGDVLPENNFERFATVGLMYIGVLVFALLLTEIQDAIGEAFLYQREVARALARTRDFLIEHEIPAELCSRVLRWLEFDYPIRQHWQRQKEALDHVPMVLRRLLFSHMHRDILYKVPFLVDIQSFHKDEFLVDLYSRFQPMTMPGNMPFSLPGRMADGLHYIVKGSVHAEIEGRLVSSLNPGDIFGSDLVLFDEEQRQEFGHFFNLAGMPCEIYSDSHVHCLCLTASDFEDAVRSYPRELRGEIEICKAFLGKRMRKTWETITNMGATEMIMHARWWVLLQKIGRHRREVPRTHFDIFGKRNMSQLSESKLFDPSKLRNYAERMKFSVTGGWNSHSWRSTSANEMRPSTESDNTIKDLATPLSTMSKHKGSRGAVDEGGNEKLDEGRNTISRARQNFDLVLTGNSRRTSRSPVGSLRKQRRDVERSMATSGGAFKDIDSEEEERVNGIRGGATCDQRMLQTILAEIKELRMQVSELRADRWRDANHSGNNDMLVLHLEQVHDDECSDLGEKAGVDEFDIVREI